MPHASVKASDFYMHIASTIPEPIRVRHLLIWCTQRATDAALLPVAESSKSRSKSKVIDETPRTAEGDRLLKDIMDDLLANFAKGGVDTNIFQKAVSRIVRADSFERSVAHLQSSSSGTVQLRPHPKNVANREIKEKSEAISLK
jgi:kinetochore protein Mis13/DSN1